MRYLPYGFGPGRGECAFERRDIYRIGGDKQEGISRRRMGMGIEELKRISWHSAAEARAKMKRGFSTCLERKRKYEENSFGVSPSLPFSNPPLTPPKSEEEKIVAERRTLINEAFLQIHIIYLIVRFFVKFVRQIRSLVIFCGR